MYTYIAPSAFCQSYNIYNVHHVKIHSSGNQPLTHHLHNHHHHRQHQQQLYIIHTHTHMKIRLFTMKQVEAPSGNICCYIARKQLRIYCYIYSIHGGTVDPDGWSIVFRQPTPLSIPYLLSIHSPSPNHPLGLFFFSFFFSIIKHLLTKTLNACFVKTLLNRFTSLIH